MEVSVNGKILAKQGKVARTFFSRLMGLMFTKKMNGYDVLLFSPGNSIHTCFMRYPIDVVFLDKENRIIKIIRNMAPWRFTRIYWRSTRVLEFTGGTVGEEIRKGDVVCIN